MMADSVVNTPPPADSSAVRPVACLRCRNRRTGCSKEHPKCSRCREGSYECIYPEGRKITISEGYLRSLEARLEAFENVSRSGAEANAQSSTHLNTIQDTRFNSSFEEVDHPLLKGVSDLYIDRLGKSKTQYLESSASTIIGRRLGDIVGIVKPIDGSLDIGMEKSFYNRSALRLQRPPVADPLQLPPYPFAKRLFNAQYTYIGTIFAFVDPESFELQLQDAMHGPPDMSDREACLAYSKVLTVLAFGQLYSVNQWNGFDGPPGIDPFTHALHYLPAIHEESSILFVETLALVGYFMQNLNRRDAAFLYVGIALRMAISLALHQEVSSSLLDDVTKEHRRRVWWSVYSLERILSVKSGNPITIQDKDIGVNLPSRLPNEPDYCPPVVLRHYTELSRILTQIVKKIYRKTPKSGSSLVASVQSILMSLFQWHQDIPDELRFHTEKLEVSRETVSTFLHYYQCINMTVRPLLFHVVQRRLKGTPANKEEDWRHELSPTTIWVIERCVSAAQDTITMMTIAAQKDLVATYGYMDGEHAFSAAIVLVMVCFAFPYDAQNTAAMDSALTLLQRIADRGNTNIGSRYQLLARVRSMIHIPAVTLAGNETPNATVAGTGLYGQTDAEFPRVDNAALGQMSYDTTADLGLWEEGFMNQDINAEFDLTQWTGAAMTDWENNST